ncbi:MAG TPA: hypothetical protein VNN79_08425, partial [Actinomycetota bacterium]|nr:hypothetical protein [Actinomycetota bacterium]
MTRGTRLRRLGLTTLVAGLAVTVSPLVVAASAAPAHAGAVYAETNDAGGNAVLVFHRAADGTLTPGTAVPTGGLG